MPSSLAFDFDTVVVGAGAVGLATAYALAQRKLSVLVLEAERAIGQGVSSRSSEVIHAGLYYPTGSLKARLCTEGRRRLYAFLQDHGVAYDRCGKLVVAVDAGEEPRLDDIVSRALDNDVEGLTRLNGADAKALEPALQASAALHSRESGVFDSHGYLLALQGEIEDRGGLVALGAPLARAEALPGGGFRIGTGGPDPASLTAAHLVTAAGLDAQQVASLIEPYPRARIPKRYLGKGSYFLLRGEAPFSRLVYPLPVAGALGIHYRQDLGGQARFGPDLQYVGAVDYGIDEGRAEAFYANIRRFWPGLPDGALAPDYVGLRPKIHGPDAPQSDFLIDGPEAHGVAGLVVMFGIESPGLTASLAIGEEVCGRLELPRR